jgi:TetR/AcrR family transcriptional repressor of nem operon
VPEQPPTKRGRRTREHIVRTAADMFTEHGVHATGLREVLVAAGASKSQLYHYFTDKDDLVQAVIAYQRTTVLRAHRDLLARIGTWPDLAQWLDAVVSVQRKLGWRGGCRLGSLASELAETDESARAALADCFTQWQAHIAAALSTLQRTGQLRREADVHALATATLAMIEGGLLLAQTARSGRPLTTAIDAVHRYLLSYAR